MQTDNNKTVKLGKDFISNAIATEKKVSLNKIRIQYK